MRGLRGRLEKEFVLISQMKKKKLSVEEKKQKKGQKFRHLKKEQRHPPQRPLPPFPRPSENEGGKEEEPPFFLFFLELPEAGLDLCPLLRRAAVPLADALGQLALALDREHLGDLGLVPAEVGALELLLRLFWWC